MVHTNNKIQDVNAPLVRAFSHRTIEGRAVLTVKKPTKVCRSTYEVSYPQKEGMS